MSLTKRLLLLLAILVGIGWVSAVVESGGVKPWWASFTQKVGQLGVEEGESGRLPQQVRVKVVSEESAVIDVVKKASPSVVSVVERSVTFNFFTGPRLQEASIGTGFAVGDELIITNRHVVNDINSSYSVVDAKGNRYDVSEVYRDTLNDLAILKVPGAHLEPLELGDSDQLQVGQTVIAIGNALGRFSNTVTKGVVSGIGRGIVASGGLGEFQEQLDNVIQTDAALNPGNSGGPLLNIEGQVIGVNVAISQGSENIGFAIPVNEVKKLLEDFRAGKKRERAWLGVEYVVITPQMARNSEFPAGALVRRVIEGSAAEKAGIRVNDVITKVDGVELGERTSLSREILKHQPGDKVSFTVWRNLRTLTLEVFLQKAP